MKTLAKIRTDLNALYKENKHLYISTGRDIDIISSKISAYYENLDDFSFQLLFERIRIIEYELSNQYRFMEAIMTGLVSGLIVSIISTAPNYITTLIGVILSILLIVVANKFQKNSYEMIYSPKKLFLDLERMVLIDILDKQYGYKYH